MKKKLRLQIEKLRVEQFEAHPNSPVIRGTAHGFEDPYYSYSEPDRCLCQIMPDSYSCSCHPCG
jgi:hypothetical protein